MAPETYSSPRIPALPKQAILRRAPGHPPPNITREPPPPHRARRRRHLPAAPLSLPQTRPVKGGDEEEFVENTFDCLTCVVAESEGKQKFVAAEGVELTLIMLREGKMSKPRGLRLLDHAVLSTQDNTVALRLVEAAGLKTLFGMFMKKV